MNPFKLVFPTFCLLTVLLLDPSPAETQQGSPVLESEAVNLVAGGQADWARAAVLFVEAAHMRSFGEEEAIANLRAASFLRYYIGDQDEALRLMADAAGQAVAAGKVLTAAQSYIDGAWIAIELGLAPTAMEFAESATLFAGSPHLTESESRSIRARLGEQTLALEIGAR